MFATKMPNQFYLQETNKIIEMYSEWEAAEAQNSQKTNAAQGKQIRFLGKLLTLAEALGAESFQTLKNENPDEAENLTYVRSFLNGYFPNKEVAFSEINRIRAEFTTLVLSGSYGEQWDKKRLEASAESVYKLVKDAPATGVANAVIEEKKEEPKPKQDQRGPKRGGRDNRRGGGKNRQPAQEPAKEAEKPAEAEPAAPAKPEPEEAKAPTPPKEEPAPALESNSNSNWADQEDEGEEEEEGEWESVGATSSGYKAKKQAEIERQQANQRGRGDRRGGRRGGRRGRGDRRR